MKVEKWTLGLAALGLVTLAPGLLAQTVAPQLVSLQTALSATTISGYVDTSAVWNPGTGNANPAPYAFNAGKQDGFNLDAVDIKIAKPLEEGQWSAGYTAELSYGPDAQAIDGGAYPIRQAFVSFRVPVGNGLDFELGRWDNILGYESSDAYKNPNWSRSYAYSMEPTEHTGLLASYKVNDSISLQAGVADTLTTTANTVNERSAYGTPVESKKAVVTLLSLTAPDSWGFLKGSALYAGFDHGQGVGTGSNSVSQPAHDQTEWYVGTTINTPVSGLTFGASYDQCQHMDINGFDSGSFYAIGGYVSYKATDKLTLNGRFEWADGESLGAMSYVDDYNFGGGMGTGDPALHKVMALTGTIQYDLWANVISRLEVRWDHAADGTDAFGNGAPVAYADPYGYSYAYGTIRPGKKNEIMIAANMIYKF